MSPPPPRATSPSTGQRRTSSSARRGPWRTRRRSAVTRSASWPTSSGIPFASSMRWSPALAQSSSTPRAGASIHPLRSSRRAGLSSWRAATPSPSQPRAAARRWRSCCRPFATFWPTAVPSATASRAYSCSRPRASWRCRASTWPRWPATRWACRAFASTEACPSTSSAGPSARASSWSSPRPAACWTSAARRAAPWRRWTSSSWTRATACWTWDSSRTSSASWRWCGRARSARRSCSVPPGPPLCRSSPAPSSRATPSRSALPGREARSTSTRPRRTPASRSTWNWSTIVTRSAS
mmetsp:Transcript_7888/g.33189  ORF Transcript_7888/g.33189 Transcript_7888/m.33189 type:complete len:296 (-) Transcript_7888:585-1472(-)